MYIKSLYIHTYVYYICVRILEEKKEKLWRSHEASMTNNEPKSNCWVGDADGDGDQARVRVQVEVRDRVECVHAGLEYALGQRGGWWWAEALAEVEGQRHRHNKCPISIICEAKCCDHSKSGVPRQIVHIRMHMYVYKYVYILVCVSQWMCGRRAAHGLINRGIKCTEQQIRALRCVASKEFENKRNIGMCVCVSILYMQTYING